jgi:DNA-directed RNA polymerase subunit RPC12/RpoP
MIQFDCLTCGKRLRAQPENAGKRAKCTKCGQVLIVPADDSPGPMQEVNWTEDSQPPPPRVLPPRTTEPIPPPPTQPPNEPIWGQEVPPPYTGQAAYHPPPGGAAPPPGYPQPPYPQPPYPHASYPQPPYPYAPPQLPAVPYYPPPAQLEDERRRPRRERRGFECPYCGCDSPPARRSEVSATGWVILVVMLLFCFPLFFIGLFIKDEYRVCRDCGTRLG